MPIRIDCPDCDTSMRLRDALRGKKIRCKECGTVIEVPAGKSEGIQAKAKIKAKPSADDDEDDERPTPRKSVAKSNTTLLVVVGGGVLVVLLLCLASGGASAYYFLLRKADAPDGLAKKDEKPKEPEKPVEPVTIKMRSNAVGDVWLVTLSITDNGVTKGHDAQGGLLLEKFNKGNETHEYKETILKVNNQEKRSSKLERQYTKSQTNKDGNNINWPVVGKTIVIEEVGGTYNYRIKGEGPVIGGFVALLNKEFGKKSGGGPELNTDMLPKAAVKPGDSWKLEMDPIVKRLGAGEPIVSANPTGEGRLVRTYEKDGRKYGVLEYKMLVPLTALGHPPREIRFVEGAKMSIDLTFDVCIDGSAEAGTFRIRVVLSGTAPFPQIQGGTMSIENVVEIVQTRSDVAKN